MPSFNTVFTVFSGIGFVLAVTPLWWHVKSWHMHVGTCMYMIWTAIACFIYFVNSILWNGNATNRAPVWCDISSRLIVAVAVAWPACGICIIRRLYNITVLSTPAQKRREMTIDLLITVGIPVVQMVIQYVVSGHRFNIYEDYGCGPATWNTPLAYVLVYSWPLIIALTSACYGALIIRASFKQRKEIRELLSDQSSMAHSNYWRLMALASLDFCFTIPLATWAIVANLRADKLYPWVSWADTHWGYSRVFQFPKVLLDQNPVAVHLLETTRWAAVICALVFFAFFGFSFEAKKHYRLLASTLANFFGCIKFNQDTTIPASGVRVSLQFAPREIAARQTRSTSDSDSFADRRSTFPELRLEHEAQSYSIAERLAVYKVPQIPEPVLDLALVRRTSFPDPAERV